jgi:iron complex outermembrane recepter protein
MQPMTSVVSATQSRKPGRACVAAAVALGLAGAAVAEPAPPAETVPGEDLSRLSLEELSNVEVTSVSKAADLLRQAPAAIYVITHEQIVRSGATSIPEALRLAPNLQVTQLTSSDYVVTARGFGGNPQAQNFSNKMLILIDGRSVYTPLFSGVYLDAQDVLMQDIDRIEVISGPGATLWGANAVNGVINIITRPAYLTAGTELSFGAGNLEQNISARYGGKPGEDTAYRIYGKAFARGALELADGSSAHDSWHKAQAGGRFDRSFGADLLTIQGDAYRAIENQLGTSEQVIAGGNVLGRWNHHTENSELQVQAYFDQTQRAAPAGGTAFVLHTYDLQLQQTVALGAHNRLVWGAGERINDYGITNSASLLFIPPHRSLRLGNVFAQDTLSLGESFKVTAGIKWENDPYSGGQFQPDLRLAWSASATTLLWAAAARAVRSPTPFDVDVAEKIGPLVALTGNPEFRPERVAAYEVGYRAQPAPTFSLSVSGYYNIYDDLRTVEVSPLTGFFPLQWDNLLKGHTYGVEAWSDWQAASWWRLSPGVRTFHPKLQFEPGASGLLGVAQAGDDPSTQVNFSSSMDIRRTVNWDLTLRYVGALPDPALPSYYELSTRLSWQPNPNLELALSGFNLLHQRHQEFASPYGEYIVRSVIATVQWKF